MRLSELISCLMKCKEKYGDVNVCVYSKCHEMPCEAVIPLFHKESLYVNNCEIDTLVGNFLMLE